MQSLTWSRGAHNLKGGVNFTRWYNDQNSSFTIGGNYRFNSIENFVRNITNTFEGQAPGSSTDREWRQNLIGLFVQDDWQMRRNLTINAGLRYEFITVPTENGGRVGTMPDLFATATRTDLPLFDNPSLGNVAPRGGFAWDITGDGKNSLQGGAGMFFEPILSNVYRAYGNRTPPFYAIINPRNPPFPDPTNAGTTPAPLRLDLLEYDLKNPYRVQYNLTYQRELFPATVVTAGFIGARGYNQIRNIEWNQAIPTVLADGTYFFPPNPVRRNPAFESMRLRITDGESWYRGLIVGASRRFRNNLALQASYTLGKSEDLGSQAVGSGDFDNSFQPAYGHDPESNKGLSDFDIRHNFVFNYTYELPLANSATGLTAALAHGWQFSGIVTVRSGVPVLATARVRSRPCAATVRRRRSATQPRAGRVTEPGPGRSRPVLSIRMAFTLPEAGFLGDVPRNTHHWAWLCRVGCVDREELPRGSEPPAPAPPRDLQRAEPRQLRPSRGDRVRCIGPRSQCRRNHEHGWCGASDAIRGQVRVLRTEETGRTERASTQRNGVTEAHLVGRGSYARQCRRRNAALRFSESPS